MNIKNSLKELAEKYSLKEKAFAHIDEVMDACIASDREIGIDFLKGNDRADLIYEFGRFEFQLDGNDHCRIVSKIKIYSKRLYGPNYDIPVGYYEEWTDLEGEHLDEFLLFDWSPIELNLSICIERLSKQIPPEYANSDTAEYEFVSYVNHIIFSVQGRKFEVAIEFVERCLDFLDNSPSINIQQGYLEECVELFERVYHHVNNNQYVSPERISKHHMKERIKNRKPKKQSK